MSKKIEEMTGACLYCGQTRIVVAASQEEADLRATEECACDNPVKKSKELQANINELCGKKAPEYGYLPLGDEIVEALEKIGDLQIRGYIEHVTVKVPDSKIVIKTTNRGTKVSREKTVSASYEV